MHIREIQGNCLGKRKKNHLELQGNTDIRKDHVL